MVGFDPTKTSLSKKEYMLAGGCAAAVARAVSQPLDVVKIRFQVRKFQFSHVRDKKNLKSRPTK